MNITYEEDQQTIWKAIKLLDGQYTEFEGSDHICMGWDGQGFRCECGQQRVFWLVEKTDNVLHAKAKT